jgi:hypothetical protein
MWGEYKAKIVCYDNYIGFANFDLKDSGVGEEDEPNV